MLPQVTIGRQVSSGPGLIHYRSLVGDEIIDEVLGLARELKEVRICHVNATSFGGGVAELLSRYLPLLHAIGVSADWRLIHGEAEFFTVTKAFHNALQGGHYRLQAPEQSLYLEANERSARLLESSDPYDVYIVHDPQPAAIRHFAKLDNTKWIWRCHIDSSTPDAEASRFFRPFIEEYDAAVFTMPSFLLPELDVKRAAYIAPAIDPLATKNMELPMEVCKRAVADWGIDPDRPLLVQVSRFDPWKDPLGVIQAYRLVKERLPRVQLALIASMATDDPQGWELLSRIEEEAERDPDLYVLTNFSGVGNMEVNAFQRASDVVIQKSIREGFGLVVAEAFWKEKPVVAGNAGGIPLQFPKAYTHYMSEDIEGCAERILHLLENPEERTSFARAGAEHVRRHFLLPRLVRDELQLIKEML